MKQEKSQLKAGIILNYANMVIGNLIPIFYTPIMLSILGQSEYGLYKLSANITSYLTLIALGISSAVVRYLILARVEGGKENEEKMLGLFVLIFHIIAVVSLIAGLFLSQNIDILYAASLSPVELQRMRHLVFILACNTAISFLMTPYISAVNAHESFIFLQSMNILLTCAGPILNLIVLFMGYKSVGMATSTLFISVISRIVYLYYVIKNLDLHPKFSKIPKSVLLNILQFSFWIFLGNIVGQLYNATDTIMIGAVPGLGSESVAVYNIGLLFNSIMLSITTGISNSLSPKINKMVMADASGEALTDLGIRVGRLQSYIMMLVISGFIVFGRPFIKFYVGTGYELAYGVAISMMIPNIIPLLQSAFCATIVAQNKHCFRSLMYLAIAIMNVVGTWLLLKPMGIIGAALMTGFGLFLGQGLAMNWFYHYRSGLNVLRFWKNILPTLVCPILLCVVSLFFTNYINLYNPITLILCICVYTIVYIVLVWTLIFNDYEKGLVLRPLQKILEKVYERF